MSLYVPYFSRHQLRGLRVASGLSRTDVAARVGVSVETLVSWEQGRSTPRADTLGAISAVLGCCVDDLFSAHGDS